MEIEAKYALSGPSEAASILALPLIAACRAGEPREITMESTYYGDEAGRLRALGFTLRLRRENGTGVCCLKWKAAPDAGAVKARHELERPAETIGAGVAALIAAGAPPEFAETVRTAALRPAARLSFVRTALPLCRDGMEAELALDRGTFGSAGQMPFCELEIEWKSGPEAVFYDLLRELEQAAALRPQPLSKLARALAAEAAAGPVPGAET